MANEEHLKILKQGVNVWNRWREENPDIFPSLTEENLEPLFKEKAALGIAPGLARQIFLGSKGYGADLSGVNFSNTNLWGARLQFVNLSGANLVGADLTRANLRYANLSNADLTAAKFYEADLYMANLRGATCRDTNMLRARLVSANLSGTILDGCWIHGVSVWGVTVDEATKQKNLRITDPNDPEALSITVDDIEVAQFIDLLLKHNNLRNILNAVTKRGVLILGPFANGGLKRLQAIAAKLRELDYLPIIFDFERPDRRNYTETIKTLAGLSRFIIADLSGPSVPQELYAIVPHFKIPVVPILEKGVKPFALITDILEYPWVLRPPVEFENEKELLELLPTKIVAQAEKKHEQRQKLLEQLFS
ncbi:MAG: pentapeptide repeat-containing protein [Chloroflexota bacterium]